MNEKIEVGDGRALTAAFSADGESTSVDVADVHLTIRQPDGVESTYNATDLTESQGVVSYELTFTMPGYWHWCYEWHDGTNAPQVAEGKQFVEVPRVSRQTL